MQALRAVVHEHAIRAGARAQPMHRAVDARAQHAIGQACSGHLMRAAVALDAVLAVVAVCDQFDAGIAQQEGEPARSAVSQPPAVCDGPGRGRVAGVRRSDAGIGFLRQQAEPPANLEATKQAWPLTVAWFRKYVR